jgi:hypothetical protein
MLEQEKHKSKHQTPPVLPAGLKEGKITTLLVFALI